MLNHARPRFLCRTDRCRHITPTRSAAISPSRWLNCRGQLQVQVRPQKARYILAYVHVPCRRFFFFRYFFPSHTLTDSTFPPSPFFALFRLLLRIHFLRELPETFLLSPSSQPLHQLIPPSPHFFPARSCISFRKLLCRTNSPETKTLSLHTAVHIVVGTISKTTCHGPPVQRVDTGCLH
jgi:hypothetical protein